MFKLEKFRNTQYSVRVLTGAIISLHGLLRIIFIDDYVNFVLASYSEVVGSSTLLLIGATFLPFLEFFTGLLIIFKVAIKRVVLAGVLLSVVMIIFILLGQMYPRIIYHAVVIILLAFVGELNRRKVENNYHLYK